MKTMTKAGLLGVVIAFALANTARADIVYGVDLTVGTGTVTGFIETDGNTGTIANSDIINWDLTLTDLSSSVTLTGPDSGGNSTIGGGEGSPENVSPAQWYATTTELLYDYNGPGDVSFGNAGAYLCFEDDYCSDVGSGVAFKIGSDSVEYTVASTGDGFTNDGPTLQNSGIVGTTVPEPSSVILLLTMLLAVAYVARKPIAQATRMKG